MQPVWNQACAVCLCFRPSPGGGCRAESVWRRCCEIASPGPGSAASQCRGEAPPPPPAEQTASASFLQTCVSDVKNAVTWTCPQELLQKLDSDLDTSVSRDFHTVRDSTPLSSSTPWRSTGQRRGPHRVRSTFN